MPSDNNFSLFSTDAMYFSLYLCNPKSYKIVQFIFRKDCFFVVTQLVLKNEIPHFWQGALFFGYTYALFLLFIHSFDLLRDSDIKTLLLGEREREGVQYHSVLFQHMDLKAEFQRAPRVAWVVSKSS